MFDFRLNRTLPSINRSRNYKIKQIIPEKLGFITIEEKITKNKNINRD